MKIIGKSLILTLRAKRATFIFLVEKTKFIENTKNVQFWRVFFFLNESSSNRVARQVNFSRTTLMKNWQNINVKLIHIV